VKYVIVGIIILASLFLIVFLSFSKESEETDPSEKKLYPISDYHKFGYGYSPMEPGDAGPEDFVIPGLRKL